eukprot:1010736-Prymnesium_polylepis.1
MPWPLVTPCRHVLATRDAMPGHASGRQTKRARALKTCAPSKRAAGAGASRSSLAQRVRLPPLECGPPAPPPVPHPPQDIRRATELETVRAAMRMAEQRIAEEPRQLRLLLQRALGRPRLWQIVRAHRERVAQHDSRMQQLAIESSTPPP